MEARSKNSESSKEGSKNPVKINIDFNFYEMQTEEKYLKVKGLTHEAEDACMQLGVVFKYKHDFLFKSSHDTIIEGYIRGDNKYGYLDGVLSLAGLHKKFNIDDNSSFVDGFEKRHSNMADEENAWYRQLEISLDIPASDTDRLLQLLSILDDTIFLLHQDGIATTFTIIDIIKALKENYEISQLATCKCANLVNQLINIISINSELQPGEAILLLYCFNALQSFDLSSLSMSSHVAQLNNEIMTTIDKLFLTKWVKSPGSSSSPDEKYEMRVNKQEENELCEFLNRLHLWQRIKFYRPCLGKPADDGGVFHWRYTQWDFLRDTQFINQERKVCIDITREKNLKSGYLTWYASGTSYHDIFSQELLALAPHINLQFSDKVDWHNQITFTPECSNFLFNMNLHHDINTIKTFLKARNNHRFFEQAWGSGSFKEILPQEIVKLIFTMALGPIYSAEELALPFYQSQAMQY